MDQLQLQLLDGDRSLSINPAPTSSPALTGFPLPNELLEMVLEHLVHDNSDRSHDVYNFLLICRACNKPAFAKHLYHTVYFYPITQDIKRIRPLAEDVERAKLVKVLVMRDVVPRDPETLKEIEKKGVNRPNLTTEDWIFYSRWHMRMMQHHNMMQKPTEYQWCDPLYSMFKSFGNLEELHLRGGLSDTRPTHKGRTPVWELLRADHGTLEEDGDGGSKRYNERLGKNFASAGLCIPVDERTPHEQYCADEWGEETVRIFSVLLEKLSSVHFTRILINTTVTAGLGYWFRDSEWGGVRVTTTALEITYEGINECTTITDTKLLSDQCFLYGTKLQNLRHLCLSGKHLVRKGALDLSRLWPCDWRGIHLDWAFGLETLTLENVKLSENSIQFILQLSIDLSITNATFLKSSYAYFLSPVENKLRSVKYHGFIIVSDQRHGRDPEDGRVWVVGGKMQAIAAMAEYEKYVDDPVLSGKAIHVEAQDIERYMLSRGPSPLTSENMWAIRKAACRSSEI